jgi:hypothetical protein
MWKLVEVFALRAREFSDEVARLGEHQHVGEAFLASMAEVKRLRALCDQAREDLERHMDYVEAERSDGTSVSGSAASSQA